MATPRQISPTLPDWPKPYYNVNMPPVWVTSQHAAEQLTGVWVPMDLSQALPEVPPVDISPTAASVTSDAGTGSFTVTILGPGQSGTWTVGKDAAAWLTLVSPTAPQALDGTVQYSYTANVGLARNASFYVNGQTFTVTQANGIRG